LKQPPFPLTYECLSQDSRGGGYDQASASAANVRKPPECIRRRVPWPFPHGFSESFGAVDDDHRQPAPSLNTPPHCACHPGRWFLSEQPVRREILRPTGERTDDSIKDRGWIRSESVPTRRLETIQAGPKAQEAPHKLSYPCDLSWPSGSLACDPAREQRCLAATRVTINDNRPPTKAHVATELALFGRPRNETTDHSRTRDTRIGRATEMVSSTKDLCPTCQQIVHQPVRELFGIVVLAACETLLAQLCLQSACANGVPRARLIAVYSVA
jgi:hypothetical protein